MNLYSWLTKRESGLMPGFNDENYIIDRIYQTMNPYSNYENKTNGEDADSDDSDAVFNVEFSPEGNVLVAACRNKSILLFDANNTKLINHIPMGHEDCVNGIKFLDDRLFATCSDDTTVALWDIRNLKKKVRTLYGHSNWVKNIEYSKKDKLLVTSGFDGSILTWDINSPTEQGLIHQKVFHTSGLMRCRITPEGDKLVISTTGGYLILVHDLDLTSLHRDLCGFRPTIYRLMQTGKQLIPQAAKYQHLFLNSQKRNRLQLIDDFPDGNDAEIISSLQLHPKGHSFLSRNRSFNDETEWTCIHELNGDIQQDEVPEEDAEGLGQGIKRKRSDTTGNEDEQRASEMNVESNIFSIGRSVNVRRVYRIQRHAHRTLRGAESGAGAAARERAARLLSSRETFTPDIWAAEVTVQERARRLARVRNTSVTGYNFVYAISSGVLPNDSTQASNEAEQTEASGSNGNFNDVTQNVNDATGGSSSSSSNSSSSSSSTSTSNVVVPNTENSRTERRNSLPVGRLPSGGIRVRWPMRPYRSQNLSANYDSRVFQNPKKLMYYIEDSCDGKGFIKEPCFSNDGRIVASPYNNGVRLLGFTENCAEYPTYLKYGNQIREPRQLCLIKEIKSHDDTVLCTKFSPREPLLVAGCHSGRIVWNRPLL